ncbi:MAG: chorismate mutase [Symploca sp. SIO2G7]|nr:chorismate mutase [Symploca sp. SIO2G7]
MVEWRVQSIRGAITVSENTVEAIREAVMELLDELEAHNQIDHDNIISVIFTTTSDLDAIFPAAIARKRPNWDDIALLDTQQMHVEGSLNYCIRCLLHINMPTSQVQVYHPYLRKAKILRPDRCLIQAIPKS